MTRFLRHPLHLLLIVGLSVTVVAGCASSRDADRAASEPSETIDTGYGTHNTDLGSASTVDADDVSQETAESVADLLRGRVAGVDVREVAGGIAIRIRGAHSFTGSSEPLYVLDGMPVEAGPGGVLGINPRDIEKITVLKGPETSLYGARGGNGVIVIRTKRGG